MSDSEDADTSSGEDVPQQDTSNMTPAAAAAIAALASASAKRSSGKIEKASKKKKPPRDADKRHSHNLLERKRRDHIKERFTSLKDVVPTLDEEQNPSRSAILHEATVYINKMREATFSEEHQVRHLQTANQSLAKEVQQLEAEINKR
ncbi:hypothetical protein CAOG_05983 [Capsaspora owczarzaki ATCC 30864]|uniref:BHLH domain-containing protein n=1 Tax=Capsaspora owczarzaki (strain ATCC 30864) TaxID=595528 RepID=A0A0D2WUE2_CAPO3|nr:hypothetical protein CAOG_05983 [Capsaspora owczarzaki ATCC 30864]KJE95533.1 hypothetical protein CAOG_005983 [Capsaspora owczarzaki ATCC 30864]|eukprot:XP_004345573.1 hypothetical protein CAOG_05983 [Capsaspora owczarzaki ATCC 30864]